MSVTMLPMMTVGLAVVPFFVIYLLGRAGRSGPDRDPMLGAKVAVHLIVTVCFQLVLAGAALLLVATTNRHMGFLTDTAAGLLVGALVAGIVPAVLLFTIAKRDGGVDVGRQALGVNAITTGLATVTALVSMFVMAFNGGEVRRDVRPCPFGFGKAVGFLLWVTPPQMHRLAHGCVVAGEVHQPENHPRVDHEWHGRVGAPP